MKLDDTSGRIHVHSRMLRKRCKTCRKFGVELK